ncbi:MAG TPA: uracil-DNA glycosylase [Terriglobales bacterium]|jgi:uracil-DNA glycosylase family 4|nr:uracil-DNA glycosylase [Terriglobales bacterium]
MARVIDSKLREQIAARLQYYREMGIYDFYRRESSLVAPPAAEENSEEMARKRESSMVGLIPSDKRLTSESAGVTVLEEVAKPRNVVAELCAIGDDIGECTRCRLSKGRKNIVFGTGNEHADLMFVGEGPGADEDEQGLPFVGRAGQLLNNMIAAMGLRREDVYIANVVKCRPPGNRTPERDECETCIPFLMRQIAAIRPKVIVALGATAAKNLLAINSPMGELRGRWYDFRVNLDSQGRTDPNGPTVKLAVTYHPAFLLRDPRQKKETWKDLQMVMKYLGLKPKTST